jgi:hypothetical protein
MSCCLKIDEYKTNTSMTDYPTKEGWLLLIENVDVSNLELMKRIKELTPDEMLDSEEYSILSSIIDEGGFDAYLDKCTSKSLSNLISLVH